MLAHRVKTFLTIALVWFSFFGQAKAGELYAIVGQSNADGRSSVTELPKFKNVARIKRYDFSGQWGPAVEPWNLKPHDLAYQIFLDGEEAQAGPVLAFGDKLADLRSSDIEIVSATKGGSPIAWYARNLAPSTLYGATLARLNAARAGRPLRGIVFWQGESDAMDEISADQWPQKFLRWVIDIRADLSQPNLPIALVMLGPTPSGDSRFPAWERLKVNQLSMQLPPNVIRVDIGDLRGNRSVHYPTETIVEAGRRAASALASLIND